MTDGDPDRGGTLSLQQNKHQEETATFIFYTVASLSSTFALVIVEDGQVSLQDVVEQESSALCPGTPRDAEQFLPKGGLDGEVPWSWNAVFS